MSFNFNWIDIIMACIVARVMYVSMSSSVLIEIFRNIGMCFSIVFALHYFSRLGQFLYKYVFIPKALYESVALILIAVTVVLAFKFIAHGWAFVARFKPPPFIDKWGSMFLGIVRSVLTCSLALFCVLSMSIPYFSQSAHKSFTGTYLIRQAPRMYKYTFDNVITKAFPNEFLNVRVFALFELGMEKKK